VNNFRYTGREWDSETSLYYYRARYYDPATGRFLSEDEIGHDEGMDLYLYVRNNPINLVDPTGFYTLKGFPPALGNRMRQAIDSAISAVGKSSCDSKGCAGPWGQKVVKALQEATFVFVPGLKSPSGLRECASSSPLNTKTIKVSDSAFNTNSCGCLPSTLAHEAMHKAQQSADEHFGGFGPAELEKSCFPGCQ
jgi:RHS repeat-associated protein